MDEATANVDVETDALIQSLAIRQDTSFQSATVITIAHRLNTIASYDKVMVMEAGKVVEFGTLLDLLESAAGGTTGESAAGSATGSAPTAVDTTRSSVFRDMCIKSGDFDTILAIARGQRGQK